MGETVHIVKSIIAKEIINTIQGVPSDCALTFIDINLKIVF